MTAGLRAVCLVVIACLGPGVARAEPSDGELRARIEERLGRLAAPGGDIRVAVERGDVVLYGTVRLLEHSLRAEQAVWQTPGVRDVDNELHVAPLARGTDAAIEREIRAVLASDARFLGVQIQIEVESGEVLLRGRIPHPGDVLALKHRVAAIDGVVSIEIEPLLIAGFGGSGRDASWSTPRPRTRRSSCSRPYA